MALTFLNGGTPAGNAPYTGVSFTDLTSLLTQLETTLTTAGWVTVSGTPASGEIFMEGDLGGDKCYISFDGNITPGRLYVRGSDDNIKTNIMPGAFPTSVAIDFTVSQSNILFLTADSHAGVFCILPFAGVSEIVHFGFCDRIVPTDTTCVYVGKVFTAVDSINFPTITGSNSNAYSYCRVLGAAAFPGIWTSLETPYVNQGTAESISSNNLQMPLSTVLNITSAPGKVSGYSFSNSGDANLNYFGHIGSNNLIDGNPLIGPYYYIEGRESAVDYGPNGIASEINPPKSFRGVIPFAVTGMSHLAAGTQWNTAGGEVYLTAEPGFQGMRIA